MCRFCGESYPKVHFEKEAHAFPEFIGNKYLLSHYECDSCNKQFGRTIETDMANFMCVSHATSGVRGKHGIIPKYQRSGVSLSSNGKHIDIKNVDLANSDDKNISIVLTNPSFVPIAVYKCLTKMALTLMPEDQLHNFSDTFKWIREDQHQGLTYSFDSLISIYSYTTIPFPFITALLLKRKEHVSDNIPFSIFRLAYANFSFQIYIPLCQLDSGQSYSTDQLFYIPHLTDISKGLFASEKHYVDFNVYNKLNTNFTKLDFTNLDK